MGSAWQKWSQLDMDGAPRVYTSRQAFDEPPRYTERAQSIGWRRSSMASRDLGADPGLSNWIDTLRRRLERGDLAGHPPVDIGDGTGDIPAELTIKIMLAALDSYDDLTPAEAKKPVNVAQWFDLLDDFRFLRILMGGGLQQAPAERMGRG